MRKIFIFVSTLLLISFMSTLTSLGQVKANECSPVPKRRDNYLQNIYPGLHDERLTKNMKSLLGNSLRRKKFGQNSLLLRKKRRDDLNEVNNKNHADGAPPIYYKPVFSLGELQSQIESYQEVQKTGLNNQNLPINLQKVPGQPQVPIGFIPMQVLPNSRPVLYYLASSSPQTSTLKQHTSTSKPNDAASGENTQTRRKAISKPKKIYPDKNWKKKNKSEKKLRRLINAELELLREISNEHDTHKANSAIFEYDEKVKKSADETPTTSKTNHQNTHGAHSSDLRSVGFPETVEDISENVNMIEQIWKDVKAIREIQSWAKEDFPCNVTGSWSSVTGGALIHIGDTNVTLSQKSPPSKQGFLLEPGWQLGMINLLPNTSLIMLTGFNEKQKGIASFIGKIRRIINELKDLVGECKICSGAETMTGNWLFGRSSRDCKDQRASERLFSDVWRREKLNEKRRGHLESLIQKKHPTAGKRKRKTCKSITIKAVKGKS